MPGRRGTMRLPFQKRHCNTGSISYPRAPTSNPLQQWPTATTSTPKIIPGTYYVDDQCIDCDLCRETAPANFTRHNDGGYSYVYKQPESDEERAACDEALAGCPVEAIGKDGE
jgi:ferredoxin